MDVIPRLPQKKYYIAAGIVGLIMPFLTGFLGLMPLDQSIIFEAGGRIARGEIPYLDFYIPFGLVPSLIQGLFFKVFGTSWFSYVAQAGLINGLFSIIIFDWLHLLLPRESPGNLLKGTFLAAWAFYPFTGTPFIDNHSFFFAVLGYWTCLAAFIRKKPLLLALSFPCLVLGFYSKAIPALFWVFPILTEYWFYRKEVLKNVYIVLAGVVLALFLLCLPAILFPSDLVFYYNFLLPFHIGQGRLGSSIFLKFVFKVRYFKLLLICVVPLVIFVWERLYREENYRKNLPRFAVIILMTVMCGVITKNLFYNITTAVFVTAFFVFHSILVRSHPGDVVHKLYLRLNAVLWVGLIVGISILNFNRRPDISFRNADLQNFSPELGLFVKTPFNRYSRNDLHKLKGLIASRHCIYTGDMQFLYSLCGRKNPWPIIHLHDKTTYDSEDSASYLLLKQKLVKNILKDQTDTFIQDSTIWNPDQDIVFFLDVIKDKKIDSFGVINVFAVDTAALYQLARTLKINREK